MARECSDPDALGRSLLAVAEIDLLSAPHLSEQALVALRESMAVDGASRRDLTVRAELHLLVARGWVALNEGDFATATQWYTDCLEASRRHGSAFIEAASHFNLAEAAELPPAIWSARSSSTAWPPRPRCGSTGLSARPTPSSRPRACSPPRVSRRRRSSGAAEGVLAARRANSKELLRTALLVQADAGRGRR